MQQVAEDTFYRRCSRGHVAYAFQVGQTWRVESAALRRRLPRLAAELAQALACGDISIVRAASRSAAPLPLTVYRSASDSPDLHDACMQGHAGACIRESDRIAHLRNEPNWKSVE